MFRGIQIAASVLLASLPAFAAFAETASAAENVIPPVLMSSPCVVVTAQAMVPSTATAETRKFPDAIMQGFYTGLIEQLSVKKQTAFGHFQTVVPAPDPDKVRTETGQILRSKGCPYVLEASFRISPALPGENAATPYLVHSIEVYRVERTAAETGANLKIGSQVFKTARRDPLTQQTMDSLVPAAVGHDFADQLVASKSLVPKVYGSERDRALLLDRLATSGSAASQCVSSGLSTTLGIFLLHASRKSDDDIVNSLSIDSTENWAVQRNEGLATEWRKTHQPGDVGQLGFESCMALSSQEPVPDAVLSERCFVAMEITGRAMVEKTQGLKEEQATLLLQDAPNDDLNPAFVQYVVHRAYSLPDFDPQQYSEAYMQCLRSAPVSP